MKKIFTTKNKEETQKLSKECLGDGFGGSNVVLLQGELGAGKTTFTQGVLEALGAEGPFTSPTFVIMKRYALGEPKTENRKADFEFLYHLDCYRVGAEDVFDLGWEEITSNPKNLVLVEWPERIKKIWPQKFCKISFEILQGDKRRILIRNKS